jgi:general secretion pathway protein G
MHRNKRRGFTLVELMVVIVILGIIGTMAFVFVLDKPDKAKWSKAQTEMAEIVKALNDYALEHDGEYPDGLEVVAGKFAGEEVPKDPFSRDDYQYELSETGFFLVCLGKDLAEGGEEIPNKDITYTEKGLVKE